MLINMHYTAAPIVHEQDLEAHHAAAGQVVEVVRLRYTDEARSMRPITIHQLPRKANRGAHQHSLPSRRPGR